MCHTCTLHCKIWIFRLDILRLCAHREGCSMYSVYDAEYGCVCMLMSDNNDDAGMMGMLRVMQMMKMMMLMYDVQHS